MMQPSRNEKIAFLFPGQGSQYVGMGKDLYKEFKVARETLEEADETLQFKLSKLCFEGPWETLKLTINTQPAILTISIAALRVLRSETGFSPSLVAGHSLGEYSALVAAGAIDFPDALRLVHVQGRLIQEAVPVGKGAVGVILGMDEAVVLSICREAAQGEIITPANYNCPGQIAISGQRSAVKRAISLANRRGAKGAAILPVSAPIHSPLMESAGKRFEVVLRDIPIRDARIPIVSNVDAQPHTSAAKIRELLVRQVSAPVRWEESIRTMFSQSVRRFIEIGPGKILLGLFQWINPDVTLANVENMESFKRIKSLRWGGAAG